MPVFRSQLNEDTMLSIMSAEKKPEVDEIVLAVNRVQRVCPFYSGYAMTPFPYGENPSD